MEQDRCFAVSSEVCSFLQNMEEGKFNSLNETGTLDIHCKQGSQDKMLGENNSPCQDCFVTYKEDFVFLNILKEYKILIIQDQRYR